MTNKTTSAIDLVERVIAAADRTLASENVDKGSRYIVAQAIRAAIEAHDTEAADTITRLQAALDECEPKVVAYEHAHEVAVELGYPSLTEALEALSSVGGE